MRYEEIELNRDCQAVRIPDGTVVTLPQGTPVVLTQALGESYTVQAPTIGGLFQVADKDAEALGKQRKRTAIRTAGTHEAGTVSADVIWEELRQVYDPEIPINIVDLGLIYELTIEPLPSGDSRVQVKMTLTAPGCGMGPSMARDTRSRIERLPGRAPQEGGQVPLP
jgi:probable FeS assembly SUF system protein SufT